MKNSHKIAISLLVLCLFTTGVKAKKDTTVAMVYKKPILMSELDLAFKPILDRYLQAMPQLEDKIDAQIEMKKRLLEQMAERKMVAEEAAKKNFSASKSEMDKAMQDIKQNFAASLAQAGNKPPTGKDVEKAFQAVLKAQGFTEKKLKQQTEEDIASRKYIQKEVFSKVVPPKEKEVEKFFADVMKVANGDKSLLKNLKPKQVQSYAMLARNFEMEMKPKVQASHILVKVDPKASKKEQNKLYKKAMDIYNLAKKKQKDPKHFAELVQKYSDDERTKAVGGNMGTMVKGMLPPQLKALENEAFSLDPDKNPIGSPVKTPFGYHILKVMAKEGAKVIEYKDVKEDLAKFMIMQDRQTKLDDLIAKLKTPDSVKITYDPKKDEQFKEYLANKAKNKKSKKLENMS